MSKRKKKRKGKRAERAYEGAMAVPERRHVVGADGSQDSAYARAYPWLRNWGRYLEENSDLSVGILEEIVGRAVGTGIVTIPKPLRRDGSVNEPLGAEIIKLWRRWIRKVDVTDQLHWYRAQRLIVRGQARDGEYFMQHVAGRNRGWPFANEDVPYRLELLESEMVPADLNEEGWRQGVRLDEWRRPLEFGVYRRQPNDFVYPFGGAIVTLDDVKRVPRELITHWHHACRWPATRGVSIFAPVISRLYDIKDLEESERLKNRILASWAAAIQKSPDVIGVDQNTADSGRRFLDMYRGTLIDSLAPGETIEGVGPDYPVANMPEYIADQIRRVAAGTGSRYSSISRHYDGNYAAQRQELVESEVHAQVREDDFVQTVVREVYERWLMAAVLDGKLRMPGTDFSLFSNAEYRGPTIPWIDPLKEVQADALAVEKGFVSLDQIRIKRGAPEEMIGQPAPVPAMPAPPRQLQLLPGGQDEEEDAA